MISLKGLVDEGSISSTYREISLSGLDVLSVGQLGSMDDESLSLFDGVVVADNVIWAATVGRKRPMESSIVYSCDGVNVISYHRDRRIVFILKLVNNKLVNVNQMILPQGRGHTQGGNTNMEQTQDLSKMTFDLGSIASVKPVDKTEKELDAKSKEINAIKEKISGEGGIIANRDNVVLFNQQFGRAMGFVVRTDRGIKVSRAKINKLDRDGSPELVVDAPEDVKANFNAGKKVSATYYEKEYALVFRDAKPSAPVAMIIATPVGGDVDFTDIIGTSSEIKVDKTRTDLKVHVLPMESAYPYLAAYYDKRIKEDESILGEKATWLTQKITQVKKKDEAGVGDTEIRIRSAIAIDKKSANRSTVLTAGNYVPMRGYVTMSQNQVNSEEAATALNLNIEAALKADGAYASLREADKEIIKFENGVVTSDYFKASGENRPIPAIVKFDDKSAQLSAMDIPVREKAPTKKGDGVTYKYSFTEFAQVAKRPEVAKLIAATQLSVAEFEAKVDSIKKSRTSNATAKPTITSDDYLKMLGNKHFNTDTKSSVIDIAKALIDLQ